MTKLSRCTSVLLLIDDEEAMQDVFEAASSFDLDVLMPGADERVEVSLYQNILATVPMLKMCKEYREKVVVVRPEKSSIDKLLSAGYRRFLFDTTNTLEVYVSLMAEGGTVDAVPATKIGRILADFSKRRFTIDGKEVYLSKGEQKFLLDCYVHSMTPPKGASWRIHKCRIRKRFGKDVL